MSAPCDLTFRSMGSDVRLLIDSPLQPGLPSPEQAAAREQVFIEDFARRLSRFRPDSELSLLNAAQAAEVPASPLLRTAVAAGLWAAQRSGGLVDPTLVAEIEQAGYRESHDRQEPASLRRALQGAPPRRPARAHPAQALAPGAGRRRSRNGAPPTRAATRHRRHRQGARGGRRRTPPARLHALHRGLRRRSRRRWRFRASCSRWPWRWSIR